MYHGAPDTFCVEEHQVAGQCRRVLFLIIAVELFQDWNECCAESNRLQTRKGVGHFTEHIPTEYEVVDVFFVEKLFACFIGLDCRFGTCIFHSGGIFTLVAGLEDEVVHKGDEQTSQCQRYAADAGILSEEETTQEEGKELRTADNVDRHGKAQSRQQFTGSAQRIGDPSRQAVHEGTYGFCTEINGEEHRYAEQEEFHDDVPPRSHEDDALGIAGLCMFIRLLRRINGNDTADGMQLSTQ